MIKESQKEVVGSWLIHYNERKEGNRKKNKERNGGDYIEYSSMEWSYVCRQQCRMFIGSFILVLFLSPYFLFPTLVYLESLSLSKI